jgi:UTP:GlnB (protein PII) uridylyltransferase
MSDFHLTNRNQSENYRHKLQIKFAERLSQPPNPPQEKTDPQKIYLQFKDSMESLLEEETALLEDEIKNSDNCHLLLLKRTALVDVVVQTAYQKAVALFNASSKQNLSETDIPVAIIARGGYGREEMYLRSDLDMEIVSPPPSETEEFSAAKEVIKHFEYLIIFQDIFPSASSTRHSDASSLGEDLAPEDFNQFFSLLEHRFIAGNPMVYAEFKSSIKTARLIHQEKIL